MFKLVRSALAVRTLVPQLSASVGGFLGAASVVGFSEKNWKDMGLSALGFGLGLWASTRFGRLGFLASAAVDGLVEGLRQTIHGKNLESSVQASLAAFGASAMCGGVMSSAFPVRGPVLSEVKGKATGWRTMPLPFGPQQPRLPQPYRVSLRGEGTAMTYRGMTIGETVVLDNAFEDGTALTLKRMSCRRNEVIIEVAPPSTGHSVGIQRPGTQFPHYLVGQSRGFQTGFDGSFSIHCRPGHIFRIKITPAKGLPKGRAAERVDFSGTPIDLEVTVLSSSQGRYSQVA